MTISFYIAEGKVKRVSAHLTQKSNSTSLFEYTSDNNYDVHSKAQKWTQNNFLIVD